MTRMKRLLASGALAASLAFAASSAGAVTIFTKGFAHTSGSFTDTLTFSATGPFDLIAVVSDFNFGGVGTEMIKLMDGSTMLGMTTSSGGVVAVNTFANFHLPTGTYTIEDIVTGAAHGSNVTLSAFVSSIPEPATWLTMLVGFGGMGLAMRNTRRKRALESAV